MHLLTLQLGVERPHLGRVEVAARVGRPDLNAHVMQAVRELRPDAEVPGFRKGRAPLKRVKEHYLKDMRARARARLVDSIQETVGEQVGKQYRVLGSPKPEYDEDAKVEALDFFEVRLVYDIDPLSDKQAVPPGVGPQVDTGEPSAGLPGARELGMPGEGMSGMPRPPGVPGGPRPPSPGPSLPSVPTPPGSPKKK